ncbi:MAG: DUF1345 domain-containing protein [Ferruginibacter sp.]
MAESLQKKEANNILLRIHPLLRITLSLLAALMVFFIIWKKKFGFALDITILWDVFAFSYILICWIVFFKRKHGEILRLANKDDGSRGFVLCSVLIASVASMFAVSMLMVSKVHAGVSEWIATIIGVGGMILSWTMVHTLFAFHYAHMYYQGYEDSKTKDLEFPGNSMPDYIDFAYFSFVIGMTFQVSDVEIASRKIRRTVLVHSLLAFALNTFVVALTINLIASLKK